MAEFAHAIITGGSSGIGKEIAKLLAARGANVTILARRPDLLELAKREIEEARRTTAQQVQYYSVDVAERSAVEDAMGAAIDRRGHHA